VQPFYFASDETQKSRLADPRLLGRPDDAGALVTSRSRGDLRCRSDEHYVAAGDGLPLRGSRGRRGSDDAESAGSDGRGALGALCRCAEGSTKGPSR
jgi:hypothetical protein